MAQMTFTDILTDFNCSALITEITKFILYNKQQIPKTYDKLHYAVKKKKELELNSNKKIIQYSASEKLYKKAEEGIRTLNEMFEKVAEVLATIAPDDAVKEVALIFGGSLLTPKQVYRIKVPILELGHLRKYHSHRLIMSEILETILKCDDLHTMLSKPLEPTNMYLLVKKNSNCSETWLVPKPRYKIPSFGQHFLFTFNGRKPEECSCACKGFTVFSDVSFETLPNSLTTAVNENCEESWFQAPLVFKGFKDVFVKGVSVSDQWIHSNTQS